MTSSNGPGSAAYSSAPGQAPSADGQPAGLMPGHEPHGDDGDGRRAAARFRNPLMR
jgi:hypothetical protein